MTTETNPTILVTGASGLFGGEIARQLGDSGFTVRILLRDQARAPEFAGRIETAIGDFSKPDSLPAALEGIERVFLASYDQPDQSGPRVRSGLRSERTKEARDQGRVEQHLWFWRSQRHDLLRRVLGVRVTQ